MDEERKFVASQTLEERIALLEAKVARLKSPRDVSVLARTPWWEQIRGTFKDDLVCDEGMRYGREYRESMTGQD